jgi:hypothetical protein
MKLALATAALLLLTTAAHAETYRLVHAVGNKEHVAAKGLSKAECERRKDELKATSKAVGTPGSITCLPESLFK